MTKKRIFEKENNKRKMEKHGNLDNNEKGHQRKMNNGQ